MTVTLPVGYDNGDGDGDGYANGDGYGYGDSTVVGAKRRRRQ